MRAGRTPGRSRTKGDTHTVATITKCVECPEREFDNPGSARGHANRMGHHTVEVDAALMGQDPDTLEAVADSVAPETAEVSVGGAPALTGELGAQLEELADRIRRNYATGQKAVATAWEARFQIAEALAEARKLLRGDLEFGRWVKEQAFPFASTVRGYLQWVGEYPDEARELVDTSVEEAGEPPALRKVAAELKSRHAPKKPKAEPTEADEDMEEDEADDREVSAEQALNGFLYSAGTDTFSQVGVDGVDWLSIPAADRRTATKEFRRLIDQMVKIVDLWKESGE